jgi:hypothetical protein
MSNRLPVLLLTKIDAALDRKSERFRRDSTLWLLASVVLSLILGWKTTIPDNSHLDRALIAFDKTSYYPAPTP